MPDTSRFAAGNDESGVRYKKNITAFCPLSTKKEQNTVPFPIRQPELKLP